MFKNVSDRIMDLFQRAKTFLLKKSVNFEQYGK